MHTLAEPTLEEVDEQVTTLYYLQRVNFEAADEISARALPLWNLLPKNQRLLHVAARTGAGGHRQHRHLYDRQWGSGEPFASTAALAPLLEEGNWPDFDFSDEAKQPYITAWMELIGLSEEASATARQILETGDKITALLQREAPSQAQTMRGWYVTVRTSRRSTTGWVVGGRGNTLQVLADPLANVVRIPHRALMYVPPATGFRAIAGISAHVFHKQGDSDPEKYSLKTATVDLIFPPDMARDRREWAQRVIALGTAHRDAAIASFAAYEEWKAKATPIITRQEQIKKFTQTVPEDIRKAWVEGTAMRWTPWATEAFGYLLSHSTITDAELRDAITAAYISKRPELVITEAEAEFVANPPANGADSFGTCLARTVKNTVGTKDLAPMF